MLNLPILVGEVNPYGAEPEYALYCLPENSAGGRLQRLVLGVRRTRYLDFPRYNLCVGKWSIRAARLEAERLRLVQHRGRKLVLLGSKVCGAFGVPFVPCSLQGGVDSADTCTYVVLPHPSGLNRFWNEPGAFEMARATVQREFPHIDFGSRGEE